MDIKQLFADDDAVSPVIGVILMVAITVILAAVIGAFVLDIGGSQEAAPQANWDFSQQNTTFQNVTTGTAEHDLRTVTIEHGGGGTIDASQIQVQVDGTTAYDIDESSNAVSGLWNSGGTLSAGDSVRVTFASSASTHPSEDGEDYSESAQEIYFSSATEDALGPGDTVQIKWTASDGGNTQIIADHEVQ